MAAERHEAEGATTVKNQQKKVEKVQCVSKKGKLQQVQLQVQADI